MKPNTDKLSQYDVIVVGAGHAGCEAAAAAAQMGSSVLLITMNMQTIAQMSCNPAMGGIAKGQIVREIDAMGGLSGIITDKSTIQFRMLNKSKGPAMWSPRSQNDRMRFAEEWRMALEKITTLDFWQDMVQSLLIKNNRVCGVETSMGLRFYSKTVILTNGTFLNGVIHIGKKQFGGGRSGEKASKGITEQLIQLGFIHGRMKTGTPPRLDGRTIDYSLLEEQPGDSSPNKFSFSDSTSYVQKQLSCHITYTNEDVHEILKGGFGDSPMFSGSITGSGPRYCPSIEDKINRFSERDRHQLFVEPEGRNTVEVYLNGFSTSLAEDVQIKALHKIRGLEKVKIFRPGYAIEYDYFPPDQLNLTLETKRIDSLYFAGQINGTTGYEEAACQGLMAGINAHLKCLAQEELILTRSEAYIGVLIDDLVTKGTDEPYRMFTSRAEYRSLLRQDNADIRLTERSFQIGLASNERKNRVDIKKASSQNLADFLRNQSIEPVDINSVLESSGSGTLDSKTKLYNLLLRPQINMDTLIHCSSELKQFVTENNLDEEILEQTEISIKYEGYIVREEELVQKMNRLENIKLNPEYDYANIQSLSSEARQKLNKHRPISIGQASRISGISPSDISILLVHMGR